MANFESVSSRMSMYEHKFDCQGGGTAAALHVVTDLILHPLISSMYPGVWRRFLFKTPDMKLVKTHYEALSKLGWLPSATAMLVLLNGNELANIKNHCAGTIHEKAR